MNLKKISEIAEGFRNSIVPPAKLKELIGTVSQERLSICRECPYNSTLGVINSTSTCIACGCWLRPKSKCLSCNCGIEEINKKNNSDIPLKWEAIATQEEDYEIKQKIKNVKDKP